MHKYEVYVTSQMEGRYTVEAASIEDAKRIIQDAIDTGETSELEYEMYDRGSEELTGEVWSVEHVRGFDVSAPLRSADPYAEL